MKLKAWKEALGDGWIRMRVLRPTSALTAWTGDSACGGARVGLWGAFTLVELMVTILILGILGALTLPAMRTARSKSVQTLDLNNQRQIMVALTLYCAENEDRTPWGNWGSVSNRAGWLYTEDPERSGPERFRREGGLLWSALGSERIQYCPLDKPRAATFQARPQQLSSYAVNGAIVGYSRALYPGVRLSEMRPEDSALWETDERFPEHFNDGANFPSEGVSGRHESGAINASFNGSATYVRFAEWGTEASELNRNRLWCYPRSENGR